MRVKAHLLVPGVEHRRKTMHRGSQRLVRGKLLGQGTGCCGKEQVVSVLGLRTKESATQFGRQCEGDKEMGCLDPSMQLALNPCGRSSTATLWAGLMVAGVKGKVLPPAVRAVKEPTTQGRGAAMSNGPEGAVLLRRKERFCLEELG